MQKFIVVTPVLNDWASLSKLLKRLDVLFSGSGYSFEVLAIDDGSNTAFTEPFAFVAGIRAFHVVELATNLGHQRAIAVGLTVAAKQSPDAVIVMDADGEDRPEDVKRLIDAHRANPNKIIVAERKKRSESVTFRAFYHFYKTLFRLCTGKTIRHGNFCLIPGKYIERITHSSNTWNNIAASIVRSRIPYLGVETVRGTRFEGRSTMNFPSLILHGLSAISVFLDVLAVRVVVACVAALAFLSATGVGVIGVRAFTTLAIPGWTTNVLGFLLIVMLQVIMLTVSILFMVLHNRAQPVTVPALIADGYISLQRTMSKEKA
jgi:polyisoprenyl-phosphate glycosyltransferase